LSGAHPSIPPTSPAEESALRQRLGPRLHAKRLRRQSDKLARLIHQGEGVFKLERIFPFDPFLSALLRLLGVHEKLRANFLAVRLVEREWKFPNLPPFFDGFRLLQLSDLHADLDPALTPAIVALVASTPHDAAVITGDYRDGLEGDFSTSMAEVAKICAPLAPQRFGILGNHDFLEMVPALERNGLPVLLNESAEIPRGPESIWIAGIDDPHFYKTDNIPAARRGIPDRAFSILLSHSPENHREAAVHGFDLMLSGHTHGGQICLPGGRHIVVPCRVARRFVGGPWTHGRLQGYTSPGTGACGVPARWNCPPEATLHILRRDEG